MDIEILWIVWILGSYGSLDLMDLGIIWILGSSEDPKIHLDLMITIMKMSFTGPCDKYYCNYYYIPIPLPPAIPPTPIPESFPGIFFRSPKTLKTLAKNLTFETTQQQ